MSDKNQEIVWIQNLKGFINGQFPADERWKAIFIEQLNEVNARSLATQHHQGGEREAMKAAAKEFFDIRHPATISIPQYSPYDAFVGGWTAALAQQPLSVQEGWRQALDRPFCVLFLDGRNEHGSHVLASYPRSFDTAETNIEDEAETILAEAEALGFSIGDHVWAEFDWIAPQIDNEGRTELTGYWEFKRIDPKMSRVVAPTVGGEE